MRSRSLLVAAVALALGAPLLSTPAAAAPTCPGDNRTLCGGRVVAEPEQSVTFHQFDGAVDSVQRSLEAIEALAPRYLEVMTIDEATGDPSHISFGGRPMWVVRFTDEQAPREGKAQVAASLSVHGLEAAGREGGLRYVEDLARWAKDDPNHLLYAGDKGFAFHEVARRTETWFGFTNSDGWAAGDLDTDATDGPGFKRGNDNGGQDLNRDYATVGWYDRITRKRGIAESEPETRGWARLVDSLPNLKTSTDIHGELTTPNNAFSDLILPAGQWTPKRQDQVNQLSLDMIRTVERKFAEEGVVLQGIFGLPSDGLTPRRAANVAAAYDIVGYDDSGFMGDWFSQRQDSVHMDVENFLSNLAPNSAYSQVIEQAHVAAVRGNLEATIVEALVTDAVRPTASYGRVAYVDDPNRTSSDPAVQDGEPGTGAPVVEGETQIPYDVSRMDYFPVLREAFGAVVDPLSAEDVAAGGRLAGYDTLVVTDMELPRGSTADRAAYVRALDAFAQAGGQILLTDRALGLLDDLAVVPSEALTVNRTDAGHVDFVAPLGDHPYEQGLVGKPSQTFYEVMLGYPSRFSTPNYGIERGAWEQAGGLTVATVGDQDSRESPNTALGTIARGKGRITVFGAILPQAIESLVVDGERTETPHPFGLASYAVTITGGQVLDNVLAYSIARDAGAGAGPGTGTVGGTGSAGGSTGSAAGGRRGLAATGPELLVPAAATALLAAVATAALARRRAQRAGR